jgi:cyanate permease
MRRKAEMKPNHKLIIAGVFVLVGLVAIALSPQIASFVTTERIASGGGKGAYYYEVLRFPAPRITARWAFVIATIGFLICACGVWISGVMTKRAKENQISN